MTNFFVVWKFNTGTHMCQTSALVLKYIPGISSRYFIFYSLLHILIVQKGFVVIFPYMHIMYFDHIHPLILSYPPLPLKALQLLVGNEHLEVRELQFNNRTWHTTGCPTVFHEQSLCGHGGHAQPPGLDGHQVPDLEPLYRSCRRRNSTPMRRTLIDSGPSSWQLTARSMLLLKGIRIQQPHDYFRKCSDCTEE
jgi:hypothetical protein